MTAPGPGTPATSDERLCELVADLINGHDAADQRYDGCTWGVGATANRIVAAVRPLIEASARADERERCAQRILDHANKHAPMPDSGVPSMRRRSLLIAARVANPVTAEDAAAALRALAAQETP